MSLPLSSRGSSLPAGQALAQTLRQCWPNPFSVEQEGCSMQYYQGSLYHICRWDQHLVRWLQVATGG